MSVSVGQLADVTALSLEARPEIYPLSSHPLPSLVKPQGYQKAKPVHAGPEVRRRVGGRPSRLHGGTLPVIEVRDDGDIFIDGKLLIGTVRFMF